MSLASKLSRQARHIHLGASRNPSSRVSVLVRSQVVPGPAAPGTAPFQSNGAGGSASFHLNGSKEGSAHAQQPVVINVPEQLPGVLSPPAAYEQMVKNGEKKASSPPAKILVSGILAGFYIAAGGLLANAVAGGMASLVPTLPGVVKLVTGLIFPVGLTLVILSGAELYTGNTAVVATAVHEKKATWGQLIKNWFWSYTGNFLGSLVFVAAVAATGILTGNTAAVNTATYKSSLPLGACFIRAVICNWLVCMAVWNATAATTLTGKMAGLWGPIATFVAIGLEHSVANMFFIPMGIVLGAKVTFTEFLVNNLIPVTLGNTLGGFLFVGTAFAYLYGSLGKKPAPAPAPAQ